MRGVTISATLKQKAKWISTHTPHAGRDGAYLLKPNRDQISTHTPHAGRDKVVKYINDLIDHFYSHAPCGA